MEYIQHKYCTQDLLDQYNLIHVILNFIIFICKKSDEKEK